MGKRVLRLIWKMGQIIETITKIYDIISGCYFDHVESMIEAITTKEYYDIQEQDYCEKLLKLCKEFKGEHKKLENICREVMEE